MNYAEKFCNHRKNLRQKYSDWQSLELNENILTINSPDLLAAFAGYLKSQIKNANVYFRGEKELHKTSIPCLFRFNDFTNQGIDTRFQAFREFSIRLTKVIKATRVKEPDFESILQHYGIKTTWLDLVDNIFIAIWFSNYDTNSKIDYTYIKFFSDNVGSNRLKTIDLRKNFSSLSLRPHCQHGISAIKEIKTWNTLNCDYSSNLIAIAKIPNNNMFKLSGHIFTKEYMFPSTTTDNTLKILKRREISSLMSDICKKHELALNELGSIK